MIDKSVQKPQIFARDYDAMRAQLEVWLRDRLPGATVSKLIIPPSNGVSSETVLFDIDARGVDVPKQVVARIAPDPQTDPLFPRYDMERQFRTMTMVAENSTVPVPNLLWLEVDSAPIGAPFIVMERVDGLIPPDVMPYTFGDNWFYDAARSDQELVEQRSIEVLAQLHKLSVDGPAAFLADTDQTGTSLRRHVEEQRNYYSWVISDGMRSPLVERGFEWLDEHWPSVESDSVFNWGDARIGNMIFKDFEPVAVLDWEMASLGPRELDLSWMIYMHRFFQDLALDFGLPGMTDSFARDVLTARYEGITGYTPRDLDFYIVYAALRHAIMTFRIAKRQARFDGTGMPEDPDQAILYREHLSDMLDGSYWTGITG
jgi:aminoglycoside phosphotransferase (APT) family kinase protein